MISLTFGKWLSKLRMEREDIFLTYWMIISTSSNLHTSKEVCDFNSFDIQTHYVHVLWELLSTMLQLANIGLGSSPVKNLGVYVVIIPLNQDIFFIIVWDLIGIGTLDKTLLAILSCSWWWTLTILLLWNARTLTIFIFLFFYFSDFILIFFFFSFLLFFFWTMKKAHDTAVTWHVTWCDIIGLECSRRIWKMILGHIYIT